MALGNSRIADHVYTWTKAGDLATTTTPSAAVIGATYGSAGSNSDADRINAIWRTNTSTPVADAITWFPYGPLKQYNQKNQISNKVQRTVISRNLAYRITNLAVENQSNGADTFAVAIAEDAKGRVTKRDYSQAAANVLDSYFLYDNQDRVLCETTSLVGSCPTSGTTFKNSRTATAFTNAGDWRELLRPVPGSTGLMNSFNPSGYGTSHQVTLVRQNDGAPQLGDTIMGYDARGNRVSDDNTSGLLNDDRSYTYDARANVVNVHGKYFTGGVWHDYDVASAFDADNRRVMKTFRDASTGVTAQWFFYYDAMDRLAEVRYTPDIAASSTFSVFQLFWLGDQIVLYWRTECLACDNARIHQQRLCHRAAALTGEGAGRSSFLAGCFAATVMACSSLPPKKPPQDPVADPEVVRNVVEHYEHSVDFEFRVRTRDGAEHHGRGSLRPEGVRLVFEAPNANIPTKVGTARVVVIADGRFVDVDFGEMEYASGPLVGFPISLAFADSATLRKLLLAGSMSADKKTIRIPAHQAEFHLSNKDWIESLRVASNELWLTWLPGLRPLSKELFATPDVPMPDAPMKRTAPRFPIVPSTPFKKESAELDRAVAEQADALRVQIEQEQHDDGE